MVKRHAVCLVICSLLLPLGAYAEPLTPVRMALDDPQLVCPLYPSLASADHDTLSALYEAQGFRSLWDSPQRLERLALALESLADDGLNPLDYQVDRLHPLAQAARLAPAPDACADLLASQAYLDALEHLSWGRLAQSDWQPLWRKSPSAEERTAPLPLALAYLDDPAEAFARARPQSLGYAQLRQAYARLRRTPMPEQWPAIPSGPLLRVEQKDPRVPLLAERLRQAGYLNDAGAEGNLFDPALADALARFQQQHGLKADGILGPASLAELNVSPTTRRDQLRVNLERLRWLSDDLEPDQLVVDIAGARLLLYRGGELHWQTRTQVGRAARPTPELKSLITHLTLNPTWTVPPTILREDKLPEIRRDLGYLARHDLQVIDYQGRPLDPLGIDWNNPGRILLRQAAGPSNPLGRVAIRFANPFAVYLHDTPSQQLFSDAQRTFSSGCVRVEGALTLIDLLLTEPERERFATRLASGRSQQFDLARPLPILMSYWTVEITPAGAISYRPDIYDRDPTLIDAFDALDQVHRQKMSDL